MNAADTPAWRRGGSELSVRRMEVVSASTVTINPPYDGLQVNADCTVTLKGVNNAAGETVTVTLPANSEKPWVVDLITAINPAGAIIGLRKT